MVCLHGHCEYLQTFSIFPLPCLPPLSGGASSGAEKEKPFGTNFTPLKRRRVSGIVDCAEIMQGGREGGHKLAIQPYFT